MVTIHNNLLLSIYLVLKQCIDSIASHFNEIKMIIGKTQHTQYNTIHINNIPAIKGFYSELGTFHFSVDNEKMIKRAKKSEKKYSIFFKISLEFALKHRFVFRID